MRTGRAATLGLLLVLIAAMPLHAIASDLWGGSIGFTNDYLVRGISRSNHDAGLQGDVHAATRSGFIGGLFVSTIAVLPRASRNAELNPYLGFTWALNNAWRTKIIGTHYAYPWIDAGTRYHYDELSADATYRDWLNFNVVYSPNYAHYIPYRGPTGVVVKSGEMNLQAALRHNLTAAAGLGISHVAGPDPSAYLYWSAGIRYDLAPAMLSVTYVNTSAGATDLFYEAAARNRWNVAIIWHF